MVRSALGTGAAAVLAACGAQGANGTDAQPAANKQPVTLTQLSRRAGGSEGFTLQQKLMDDYKKVAPHVTIEVVPGTIPQEQLVIRHTGGDPTDFVENDWGIWVDLADGKVIEDLTPYFTKDKIDANVFLGEALTTYTLQNKRWALPVSMSVDGLYYNEDLFRANNIPLPPQDPNDKSWTMEKFLDTAVKLTKKGQQQWGFGGAYNCFNTNGVTDGTYFNQRAWDDTKQKCLMDSENFRKGVQFWLDAQYKQAVWPTADELNSIRTISGQNAFTTGKVAMQVGCAVFPKEQLTFKWGLAALPYTGPAGSKNISGRMYPHALHMDTLSKAKDEVWAFFRWLMKPENASRYPEVATHSVSPIKNGSDAIQKLRKDQFGVDFKVLLALAEGQIVSGQGMLKYPGWNDVTADLNTKYTGDLKGNKIGVSEWVKTATETIDRKLLAKK
jgi:ABC-type glycerol-3-phosphate transport system substrate-binding protein